MATCEEMFEQTLENFCSEIFSEQCDEREDLFLALEQCDDFNPDLILNDKCLLEIAIDLEDYDLCHSLLNAGAKIDGPDSDIFSDIKSPLMNAITTGDYPAFHFLLHHGANPDMMLAPNLDTPIILASTADYFNKDMIEDLINAHANYNHRNNRGVSLLKNLIIYGDDETAAIVANLDNIQEPCAAFTTPLALAVTHNSTKVVNRISKMALRLHDEVDQNLITHSLTYKQTPLMLAAIHGHDHMINDLLPLSVIDDQMPLTSEDTMLGENIGCTALILAASLGHHKFVKKLLIAKADPNIVDNDGQTALTMAIVGLGKSDKSNDNFEINNEDSSQTKSLIQALVSKEECHYQNIFKTVEQLIKHGADCEHKIMNSESLDENGEPLTLPAGIANGLTPLERIDRLSMLADLDYEACESDEQPILFAKKEGLSKIRNLLHEHVNNSAITTITDSNHEQDAIQTNSPTIGLNKAKTEQLKKENKSISSPPF